MREVPLARRCGPSGKLIRLKTADCRVGMPFRYLPNRGERPQTDDMRLPQSLTRHFSLRVFFFITVTVSAVMMPLSAGATAKQLTGAPSALGFGNVAVGQPETEVLVLTNGGQTSITVSAMKISAPEFSASGLSLPLTLPAGQSVTLNVTFSPTGTGWTGGWIVFTSNASNSTLDVQLEGTGATSDSVTASPSTVSFGQVAVGTSTTQSVVLTNHRTYGIQVSSPQATGGGFSVSSPALPITLHAGQSTTVTVTFAPTSAGTSGGRLFVSNVNLDVPLTGTGTTTTAGQLSITPSAVNFGNVNVGATGSQPITMSASGANVTVSADSSSSSQFVLQGVSLPFTITAGKSSSFNVAFKPTGSGTVSGSLSFTSNASNGPNASVPLSGTGTTTTTAGQLSITPTSVNFGDVNVGATGTEAITMSATGASVTVSSDSSSSSQFVLTGASLPFTIPAGQSVAFNVAFNPTGSGTVSGSLSFTSNAASSQTLESLTGIGTATAYTVNLSWNASPGVVGYNLYRSTTSNGAYTKINSTVDPSTAYADSTVAAGQIYYYAATSVSSAGQESARSTPPLEVSIP